MPAIKKKWIKASQDGDIPDNENDDVQGDEDKDVAPASEPPGAAAVVKPKKRPAQSSPQNSLLRGLDGEVLSEKRKRFIPPAELKLAEWLDNNLEKRTEETLHLPHLYNYYTELCQGDGSEILDSPDFNRMVKEKFGKTFGVKETSVYKTLIKERKVNQEKKKTGSGIKLKEIIHEAINHFENPWNGIRFFSLKQYIGTKYPALQIDLRPKLLKRALEMGVQYGQIDLVKGIGMAGFYKLPGGEPPPKTKPKPKKEDGAENEDDASKDKTAEDEKENKPEDSAENGEKKEEEGEEGKKKKKHKQKKAEKISFSKLHHGSPEKIEDVFPLAITYQSAPKAASVPKIRKYIVDKYGETVPDNRWRKAIESGADKGYWEHVSGSGITGTLHLLMDDFNPGSEQIEDRICAAIIACHEPKAASANQIKKYVSQYHPEFKVDERPDKFKKALLRAVSKNMLVQLSGLGANGSFQLTSAFTPSPAILAGSDDSSDEEGNDNSDDEPTYVPRGTKSRGIPKIKTMEVVSSSSNKSGKKGQKKAANTSSKGRSRTSINSYAESSDEESKPSKRKSKKKASSSKGRQSQDRAAPKRRAHSPGSSEDEEDDDDGDEPEYTPRKSQSRGGPVKTEPPAKQSSKKAAKPGKATTEKPPKKSSYAQKEAPKSIPDRSFPKQTKVAADEFSTASRGKAIKSPKSSFAVREEPSAAARKSQKSVGKGKKPAGKPPPPPSPSPPPSPPPAPQPKGKKISTLPREPPASKKPKFADGDEEDGDSLAEPEYTPRKSKSRGGTGGEDIQGRNKGKKSKSRKLN